MPEPNLSIVETLRSRILRGIQAGTLAPGDRLPSARELVSEFEVDHRLVLSAYRELEDEGLVEIRERGGVYIAPATPRNAHTPALPIGWFVDTLASALGRGISTLELSEWLRRSLETVRIRTLVVSSTEDQVAGLARELREDFGLVAEGITAAALSSRENAIARADLLVATRGHVELVQEIGGRTGLPVIVIDVRPDLVAGEWAMLLRQPVWAVVATAEFGEMLRQFFANVRGVENLRILVLGRDDLSEIPADAPTYLTHRVRETIGPALLRGRVLPPARTIATESSREILDFVVRANLRSLRALRETESLTDPKRAQ